LDQLEKEGCIAHPRTPEGAYPSLFIFSLHFFSGKVSPTTTMKVSDGLWALAGLASLAGTVLGQAEDPDKEWPILDNGLNKVVQWYGNCPRRLNGLFTADLSVLKGSLQLLCQRREAVHFLRRGMCV
jgi:hypothetical protein